MFWRVKLATFWQPTSIAKSTYLAKVGLFLKGVQFSLEPFMTIHFLSQLKLTQTLRITLYKLHFCFISSQNSQEKDMGSHFLTHYFLFLSISLLIL